MSTPSFPTLTQALASINQSHLLTYYPSLSPDSQSKLLAQIKALDLRHIPKWVSEYVTAKPDATTASTSINPAPYYAIHDTSWDRSKYAKVGEQLLRDGKVAAFTVAGGQGTRLGYDGPKGCYPATPITNKPLFQVFAEGLLAAGRKYGRPIPWYIMTSPLNHAQTVAFFTQHSHFGLNAKDVKFFEQGVMPSFDMVSGKILLAAKDELATNPDGHGGAIRALDISGSIADMQSRGIAYLSYFQVDNPSVNIVDPVFLGLHAAAPDSSGEMSSKMVRKAGPDEKVGVFVSIDGRTQVMEYSDMPPALSKATLADGSLKFPGGSIAIHIISVEFLSRMASDARFALPFHRAEKKVPHVDLSTGNLVNPERPNAVKLEKFIFDALPLCKNSLVYETDRLEEFAPIKNATGTDSAESSKDLQSTRAARWLESVGVKVPRHTNGTVNALIELSPLTAIAPEDLKSKAASIKIDPGARITL
ncbi:MAG: UDPGP type 1 family protein [Planctomycetes bacterium]|nr:UDPGP type 1 family protein [Planctomycetota bacterium]